MVSYVASTGGVPFHAFSLADCFGLELANQRKFVLITELGPHLILDSPKLFEVKVWRDPKKDQLQVKLPILKHVLVLPVGSVKELPILYHFSWFKSIFNPCRNPCVAHISLVR